MINLFLIIDRTIESLKSTKPQFYQYDITCESNERQIDECQRKFIKSQQKFENFCGVNSAVYVKCDKEKEEDILTLHDNFYVCYFTHCFIRTRKPPNVLI